MGGFGDFVFESLDKVFEPRTSPSGLEDYDVIVPLSINDLFTEKTNDDTILVYAATTGEDGVSGEVLEIDMQAMQRYTAQHDNALFRDGVTFSSVAPGHIDNAMQQVLHDIRVLHSVGLNPHAGVIDQTTLEDAKKFFNDNPVSAISSIAQGLNDDGEMRQNFHRLKEYASENPEYGEWLDSMYINIDSMSQEDWQKWVEDSAEMAGIYLEHGEFLAVADEVRQNMIEVIAESPRIDRGTKEELTEVLEGTKSPSDTSPHISNAMSASYGQ